MKKIIFSMLLFFTFVSLNINIFGVWKSEELEKSIFSDTLLIGGSCTENREPKVIKKYQKNFIKKFDVIMTELKRIFENRHLQNNKGPDWFYNPISGEQFLKLKEIAKKLNADSKGSEFPNTKDFWNEYAKLRKPLSDIHILSVDYMALRNVLE